MGIARSFEWEDPSLIPISLDLSQIDALPEALKTLQKQIPSLDGLVCNAGIGKFGHLEQFSFEQIRHVMDLNFLAHVYLIKTFLPLMKRQKRGDIIVIGSEAALEGKKQGSIYCASKFALRGFTQALRDECRTDHVRVSLINPGMVSTSFFDDLSFAPGEGRDEHLIAEDIAQAVFLVLEARKGAVFDEINLSSQKKCMVQKGKGRG